MGYRDETETLRARVAELEGELEDARDTIGRLTGQASAPQTRASEERGRIAGGPTHVRYERELDLELTDEGLEAIAEVIRARFGGVTVSQVGRSLTAPGFSLTQKDSMTQISMVGDFRGATAGVLSLAGLGGAFGAMSSLAIFHDFVMRLPESALLPHLLWLTPLIGGMLLLLTRRRFGRLLDKRATDTRAAFEAVVELAKRHRVRERPKVRIEAEAAEEAEVPRGLGAVGRAER